MLATESSYVHKIFTLFKPTSNIQYYLEHKKSVTKFPTILDGLLTKSYSGSVVSGEGAVGGQGYTLNKMNWEGAEVK